MQNNCSHGRLILLIEQKINLIIIKSTFFINLESHASNNTKSGKQLANFQRPGKLLSKTPRKTSPEAQNSFDIRKPIISDRIDHEFGSDMGLGAFRSNLYKDKSPEIFPRGLLANRKSPNMNFGSSPDFDPTNMADKILGRQTKMLVKISKEKRLGISKLQDRDLFIDNFDSKSEAFRVQRNLKRIQEKRDEKDSIRPKHSLLLDVDTTHDSNYPLKSFPTEPDLSIDTSPRFSVPSSNNFEKLLQKEKKISLDESQDLKLSNYFEIKTDEKTPSASQVKSQILLIDQNDNTNFPTFQKKSQNANSVITSLNFISARETPTKFQQPYLENDGKYRYRGSENGKEPSKKIGTYLELKADKAKNKTVEKDKNMERAMYYINVYIYKSCKTELSQLYFESLTLNIIPAKNKDHELVHDLVMIREIRERGSKVIQILNSIMDALMSSGIKKRIPMDVLRYMAIISGELGIPPQNYFSEFEMARIPFISSENYSSLTSEQSKMILVFLFFLRVLLVKFLVEPWKHVTGIEYNNKLAKNLKAIASVFYHIIMDKFRDNLPKFDNKDTKIKKSPTISPDSDSIFLAFGENSESKQMNYKKNEEVIAGLYSKPNLSVFYKWNAEEIEKISLKIDLWFNSISPVISQLYQMEIGMYNEKKTI